MIDLSVDLGKGLVLRNPLLPASGTFGFGDEVPELHLLEGYGGLITKSITLQPRKGNPPPRIAETMGGMLNSIGLANPGLEGLLQVKAAFYAKLDIPVIVNIAGNSIEEYQHLAAQLDDLTWVAGLEVNVSCPNVREGSIEFGKDARVLGNLVRLVRRATSKFLIVKLTPNVTDIVALARSAEENGADAVALINTVYGAAIDIYTRRPKIHTIVGGYSGPAIKPIAIAQIIKVFPKIKIPIIGVGGIMTGVDVVEFMLAGARAVQLGTVNFYHPRASIEILEFLRKYCEQQGIECLSTLVGGWQAD